jgi:pimeloyl-ACP methyl ester carboxylesterase
VIEFADALGLNRFAVAGISSGAPYALACARFIPERLKGCTVVSGLPPLTVVKREKLERKQFFMGEEFLMARLANDVPFVAGALFRYFLWQLRKDPSHAIDGMPTATPHDIELLKRPEMGRAYQQMIIEAFRNGVRGPVQGMGLYLREWGFSLSDITMQVNIWHEELLFPASAKYVASKLPNHKLHMIPNVGHITLVVERAEDVLRELLAAN